MQFKRLFIVSVLLATVAAESCYAHSIGYYIFRINNATPYKISLDMSDISLQNTLQDAERQTFLQPTLVHLIINRNQIFYQYPYAYFTTNMNLPALLALPKYLKIQRLKSPPHLYSQNKIPEEIWEPLPQCKLKKAFTDLLTNLYQKIHNTKGNSIIIAALEINLSSSADSIQCSTAVSYSIP